MQNIVIDISKRGVIPPIIVTEYDSMSRFFELRLLNNGADYTPPENANYSVWYETNDSKGWYDTITLPDETNRPAVVEDGNVLTVEVAEAATTSCGELAVMVTGNGGYQLTVSGIRLVSADVPGYGGAEVEDYYNVYIADMKKNAARAENAAQTAIEYGATIDVDEAEEELIIDHYDDAGEVETWATVSEAWAVGKRNGVDVPSTDETYHNNSKYYAGQAANSAVNAAASAETAEKAAELCFTTAIKTSASGAVASFADGADNIPMRSLVAEITPVQSGSGDPSPTNIRPISGRTGLTVTRAGKNLLNMPTYAEIQAASSVVGYKSIALNLTPNTTYYLSTTFINGYTANGKGMYILLTNSATKNEPWVAVAHSGNVDGKVNGVMTTGADGILYLRFNGVTKDKLTELYANSEIQLEVGTSATAYEPYTAQTYPISWQTQAGTVYGGTLDVVSGVLTVDKGYINYDGSENWNWQDGGTYKRAACPLSDVYNPGYRVSVQSNAGTFRASGNDVGTIFASGTTLFYYPDASITSLADYKTWLASNNMQVVYPIATPQTYQLTPTEVRTMLGVNNLWSDAGDVSVEYIADTKLYIDNKIAALQALVLENN